MYWRVSRFHAPIIPHPQRNASLWTEKLPNRKCLSCKDLAPARRRDRAKPLWGKDLGNQGKKIKKIPSFASFSFHGYCVEKKRSERGEPVAISPLQGYDLWGHINKFRGADLLASSLMHKGEANPPQGEADWCTPLLCLPPIGTR